jgi:hypothetical protein
MLRHYNRARAKAYKARIQRIRVRHTLEKAGIDLAELLDMLQQL